MSISLQKANFWKRISAYLLDCILTILIASGAALAVSSIVGYDACLSAYNTREQAYVQQAEEKYNVKLEMTQEEYNALSQEEKTQYDETKALAWEEINKALLADNECVALRSKISTLIILIVCVSTLIGVFCAYFLIPVFLKNGQTLGKKVFGLAVMRSNCVKISNSVLFIRSIVGLYAMETMFPLFICMMIVARILGIVGIVVLVLFFALQIGVMIATQTNSSIHDLLSDCVVVDFASQQIFETEEALIAYKQELHAQEVKMRD